MCEMTITASVWVSSVPKRTKLAAEDQRAFLCADPNIWAPNSAACWLVPVPTSQICCASRRRSIAEVRSNSRTGSSRSAWDSIVRESAETVIDGTLSISPSGRHLSGCSRRAGGHANILRSGKQRAQRRVILCMPGTLIRWWVAISQYYAFAARFRLCGGWSLRTSLQNQVERSLGGSADLAEAALHDHVGEALLSGLRAERQPNLLVK